MKAAVIRDVGALAEVDDVAEPAGEAIEVLAAPINPIDLAVSRGVLATGHPELPYVPGCEAVGRTADGGIVWIFGGSLGRTSNGAIGERAAVGDAYSVEVPERADPALAAGLGIAGLAGCRSRGERRSLGARTCSCSALRVQSALLPSRPRSSLVQVGSSRPVVVP